MADAAVRLLKARAASLGLDPVGIAGAGPFREEEALLRARAAAGLHAPFTPRDPALRCRPELILPGARSLIAAALPYYEPFPKMQGVRGGEPRGVVARYAWGLDYHRILAERLGRLAAWLDEAVPGSASRVLVDTGPLMERAVAVRAGLGWVGKNTCLLTPRHGSWVVLGVIVTTAALPPDRPMESRCGECDLCLRACPTGALLAPGVLDHRRCLSYITQMKGVVPEPFYKRLGRRVWGCDTCQAVCPHNRVASGDGIATGDGEGRAAEAVPLERARPALIGLLEIGEEDFAAAWGETALAWRGRQVLRRNAAIALGNALAGAHPPATVARAVAALRRALGEDEPGLRAAAAWALARLERLRPS